VWKRRRPRPLTVEWHDWRALAAMVMGIDAKLDRILDELEVDDGREGD
jgi:hypothetical protein